jgi:hypothetical protein
MPSVQLERGNHGGESRERDQKNRFGLGHFSVLHKRSIPRYSQRDFRRPRSGRRGTQFGSSRQLFAQKNELADVVISVAGTAKKNHETFLGLGFTFG